MAYAILFIVLFIGTFVSVFGYGIYKHSNSTKIARAEREKFIAYIGNTDFKITKTYGDILFDVEKRKWCKVGIKHIFDADETAKATIYKKKSSRTEKGHTYDTSKYEVYIETRNVDIPIVKSVGLDQETAERIKATINIICEKNK